MTGRLRRHPALLIALALVVAGVGPVPTASAHCPHGEDQVTVDGLSTCPVNEELEETVDRLNDAPGNDKTYVLVKDLAFHPEVVELEDGGTVVFVWGDVEDNKGHDPASSGVGSSEECKRAWEDPRACQPQNPEACFHLGRLMDEPGDTYEVTVRVTDAGGVQVSESALAGEPIVGQPPLSPAFRDCPDGTVAPGPAEDTYVLPYHCGIHGGATDTEHMRAALIVTA